MKVAIALCLVALAAVKENADAVSLKKQQQLLNPVWGPSSPNEDEIVKTYKPLEHLSEYKNPETVKHDFEAIPAGKHQKRGEIFNLFNPSDRKEMIELFEILHFAPIGDLFFKTDAEHNNERQLFPPQ